MRYLFGTAYATLEGRDEWYATHDEATNYQTTLPGVVPKGYVEEGINEETGAPNDTPILVERKWFNTYVNNIAEDWIVDATNIRMREILFGYTLSKKSLSKTPFKNINISLTGRNLFFFYKASPDTDPESGYSSGNIGNGFENHALPTTRNLGVSVRLEF